MSVTEKTTVGNLLNHAASNCGGDLDKPMKPGRALADAYVAIGRAGKDAVGLTGEEIATASLAASLAIAAAEGVSTEHLQVMFFELARMVEQPAQQPAGGPA